MGLVNGLGVGASEMRRQPLVGAGGTSLSEYVAGLSEHRSSEWAWRHYKDVLVDLLRIRDARRIVEIGGGRFPRSGGRGRLSHGGFLYCRRAMKSSSTNSFFRKEKCTDSVI